MTVNRWNRVFARVQLSTSNMHAIKIALIFSFAYVSGSNINRWHTFLRNFFCKLANFVEKKRPLEERQNLSTVAQKGRETRRGGKVAFRGFAYSTRTLWQEGGRRRGGFFAISLVNADTSRPWNARITDKMRQPRCKALFLCGDVESFGVSLPFFIIALRSPQDLEDIKIPR